MYFTDSKETVKAGLGPFAKSVNGGSENFWKLGACNQWKYFYAILALRKKDKFGFLGFLKLGF